MIARLTRPVIVAGDFNMPADSDIYRENWQGYANAFSKAGFGYGWTVRGGHRGIVIGARIDHILTDGGMRVLRCETGPDVGSDHLPLIADIVTISE
jgi:endonuclease/exonuclease/phosphatase (EEP) superfamily protein YafD